MHHDVTVEGEVARVYELPLGIANPAAYRVDDGTGQIRVAAHNGAPNRATGSAYAASLSRSPT